MARIPTTAGLGSGGGTELDRMVIRLLGDGRSYFAMLNRAQATTQRAAANIRRVGAGISRVGLSMTMRVTAPIVAASAAIYKLGGDFESEMSKIVGLVGVSREQVAAWSDEILDIAPSLGKAPAELAKAMFFVTSAGFRGQEAMDVLVKSAKASAGGLGETAVIADAVTSAVNAYAASGLDAAKATDILTAAVREGKLEASALAPVLGSILPMASAVGVAFEDVAGFMAVMSRTGVDAAEASVSLQGMLMTLQKPTSDAVKMLEKAGLSFQDLRDMVRKPGGVIEAIRLLDRTFGDDEEALAAIIPNIRALRGAMNILAQDSSIVDSVMEGVADAAGATDKAFEAAAATAKFKLAAALSQLKVLLIDIGKTLLPMLAGAFSEVGDALGQFRAIWGGLSPETKKIVLVLGLVAAVLGPLLLVIGKTVALVGLAIAGFGSLVGILGAILSPIALVIAAVVGLGAAVLHWTNVGGVMLDWFGRQWGRLKDYVQPAIDGIKDALAAGDIELAFKMAWKQIELTFEEGIRPLREAWSGFVLFFNQAWIRGVMGIERHMAILSAHILGAFWVLQSELGMVSKATLGGMITGLDVALRGITAELGKQEQEFLRLAEEASVASMEGIRGNIEDLRAELAGLTAEAVEAAKEAAEKEPPKMPVVPEFELPPDAKPLTVPVNLDVKGIQIAGRTTAEALSRVLESRRGGAVTVSEPAPAQVKVAQQIGVKVGEEFGKASNKMAEILVEIRDELRERGGKLLEPLGLKG